MALPANESLPAGLSACSYGGVNTLYTDFRNIGQLQAIFSTRITWSMYLKICRITVWMSAYLCVKGLVWMINIS